MSKRALTAIAGLDRKHQHPHRQGRSEGIVARATLDPKIGNGVGPVFVDCGGEAGVTPLVTYV